MRVEHPPDHAEHEHDLDEWRQGRRVMEHRSQLRDREDEDQVEEELEQRDPSDLIWDVHLGCLTR
jgi:hypothetical protein